MERVSAWGTIGTERRAFLPIAWTFIDYVVLVTLVAVRAKLPASANSHGNVDTVGSDAVYGGVRP